MTAVYQVVVRFGQVMQSKIFYNVHPVLIDAYLSFDQKMTYLIQKIDLHQPTPEKPSARGTKLLNQ